MPEVYKESTWNVDVDRSIAGLREAADALATAGASARAVIYVSHLPNDSGKMHIEARLTYFPDNDDDEGDPDPVEPEREKATRGG